MYHSTIEITNIIIKAYANLQTPMVLKHKKGMSIEQYSNEFCKLKISLPRRSGTTTAAINILGIYKNSLLLVPNSNYFSSELIKDYNIKSINSNNVSSIKRHGQSYEIIILDNCYKYRRTELDHLYDSLRYRCNLYVELG